MAQLVKTTPALSGAALRDPRVMEALYKSGGDEAITALVRFGNEAQVEAVFSDVNLMRQLPQRTRVALEQALRENVAFSGVKYEVDAAGKPKTDPKTGDRIVKGVVEREDDIAKMVAKLVATSNQADRGAQT